MHILKTLVFTVACLLPCVPAQSKVQKVRKPQAAATIDLNTASAKEIASALDGIGPKKAAAIVRHRKKHRFQTTDDLLAVPGVGPVLVQKNLGKLRLRRGKQPLALKSGSVRKKQPVRAGAKTKRSVKAASAKKSPKKSSSKKKSVKRKLPPKPTRKGRKGKGEQ